MKSLPRRLKELVKIAVIQLGDVIREQSGDEFYAFMEDIRRLMTRYRIQTSANRDQILRQLYKKLGRVSDSKRLKLAHAFTLYLELINTCEGAWRTYRLRLKKDKKKLKKDIGLYYVITAHPTESRGRGNILLFQKIQALCVSLLEKKDFKKTDEIKHLLKLCWATPVTKHEKPTVEDEANHLFSIVLREEILDQFLLLDKEMDTVGLSSWVGGDKDGHPGVDEKKLLASLNLSRKKIYNIIKNHFSSIDEIVEFLNHEKLSIQLKKTIATFKSLVQVSKNDGSKVDIFKNEIDQLATDYEKVVGFLHPSIEKINSILRLFPGMVIPLQLREDAAVIKTASDRNPLAIERMLKTLRNISGGEKVKHYAQGFVISMVQSAEDVFAAAALVKKHIGELYFFIIPLFETKDALCKAPEILKELLEDDSYYHGVTVFWKRKIEMMLGYSDSSKGMGVLPSRLLIGKVISDLDSIVRKKNLIPIFFHGSGGSIDRGGGSVSEQTAWLPPNALKHYKATIQGEMVERTFATAEITLKNMDIMAYNNVSRRSKHKMKPNPFLEKFSDEVTKFYSDWFHSPLLKELLSKATPYSFLSTLKTGSRPDGRRKKKADLKNIRAIPWVLCWTQTRVLFPTWWGIGTTWKKIKKDTDAVASLKKEFKQNKLFASFIQVLGFTLEKVDMNIWHLYLKTGELSDDKIKKIHKVFFREYRLAQEFCRAISGKKNLLWFRPWLAESIHLRSPMIHPLNILQIIAFKNKDDVLLRKTVTGVASGMMTTG